MNAGSSGWAAVCALAVAGAAYAHHSIGMFDLAAPAWVKGRVVRYQPGSPHAMLDLEQAKPDGTVQLWSIEGPFPGRLQRILAQNGMGADDPVVKPGDLIEVCGFDLRAELRVPGKSVEPLAPSAKFLHGIVLVLPDGRMQSWGAYGKMDNCVRPGDTAGKWREFLNRDHLARDIWCVTRPKSVSIAPQALVEEIGRAIAEPCG
jgi:hypothetical protein